MAKESVDGPPAADEVEVSIFGPGKGEAIAVHVGDGQWMTIDSCKDQATGENSVLAYFNRIGVDVTTQVRLVVGTHAHDDHVAGISQIYAAAADAQFVTSSALTSTEFFATVAADADIELQLRQSVRAEYREVIEEVRSRGKFADGRRPLLKAYEQKVLFSRVMTDSVAGVRVLALSPSDEAIDRAMELIRQGTARADSRRRLSAGDPNEYAVAIWVEIGEVAILLGADLIQGPTDCGWKAVVASHRPNGKASIHKVPHHGSMNAHHPAVWSDFLDTDVISLIAPFRAGRTLLPNDADIKRVSALSSAAYLTAKVSLPASSASVRRTKAALSGLAIDVREPYGHVGQVRARHRYGTWSVKLIGPAVKL